MPTGSSSWLRTAAINAVILLVCLGMLEIAVRVFVDMSSLQMTDIAGVDETNDILYVPGSTTVYETSEFRYTVQHNRHGRRDVEWTLATLADPQNVLFIGDSMLFGVGVEHEKTIATLLEAEFAASGRPREVLNFAMHGVGPPEYLRLLEDALERGVGARTVVVGVTIVNDFSPDALPRPPPKREAVPAAAPSRSWFSRLQLPAYVKLRVSHSARAVGWMLTLSRWFGIEVYDSSGSWIFLRQQTPDQEQLFREILSSIGEMKKLCDANGRDLHGVVFPNRIQIENSDDLTGAIYDAAKPNRLILEYCDEIDIPCLDLRPRMTEAFARLGTPLNFRIDRHPNAKGNEVAARAIFELLSGSASRRAAPSI